MSALLLFGLLAATPATPPATPLCLRAEIVQGFEAWPQRGGPIPELGRPATLRLAPTASVNFSPPPERPATPGRYGGVFPLKITRAGTYAVALSAGAWIGISDGKAQVAATGHDHAPICSGIAKIVAFRLEPNDYLLQLSNAEAPMLKAMVVAK
jgi:hypothetical protein